MWRRSKYASYRYFSKKIPGAVTLIGLNNWEKIRALSVPLNQAEKSDYKDTMILLSKGPYSNVSHERAGFSKTEWYEKSYIIRKYHELTHYISRNLYLENKEAIRDEIMADMIGIIFAFGVYDEELAKLFLGIEKDEYRTGGRLENYVPEGETLDAVIGRARRVIAVFSENQDIKSNVNPFNILMRFEEEKLGM